MRQLAVFLILLLAHSTAILAQGGISGTVVDSLSGKGLASASVVLLRGGKTLKFSRTDSEGRFSLDATPQQGDELQATMLGYGKHRQQVSSNGNIIRLSQHVFQLKEVKVQGPSVRQLHDTITYDLTKFTTERDNNLKDVLKKLPGVDVESNGQIKYNGKSISRFTVEGLDLSKGQYNKLTENIRAKDVKKAEVVEHDQPIKALRNRVFTDNVGMNIVLKDSARDNLAVTLRPYLLIGKPTHAGGDAVGMQIDKKRQMEYTAQYDRTGRDLSNQFSIFYDFFRFATSATLPRWFNMPALSAPIDEERLRFNTSQAYSVDYLNKGNNDSENSFSASYNRNVIRQHTQNISQYFLNGQSATETTEDQSMILRQDAMSLDYNHRINAEKHFGNIVIKTSAKQDKGLSTMSEATSQEVKTPEVDITAALAQTYTLSHGTLQWQSTVDFHHSRNDLNVSSDSTIVPSVALSLTNNDWHTAHTLSWNRDLNRWHQDYNIAIEAENLNVADESNGLFKISTSPEWYFKNDDWRIYFLPGLTLQRLTHQQTTMLLPKAGILINRDYGNRADWRVNVMYSESAASWSTLAISHRQTDYRTWTDAPDFVPRLRMFASSFAYNYKRAIYQFFSNLRLNYSRNWNQAALDMRILDGNYHYSWARHATHSDDISATASASKGWHALHLKTELTVTANCASGEQYSTGRSVGFRFVSWGFQPVIVFSPSWAQIDYQGNFAFNRSKTGQEWMHTLANWTQRLSLTATISHIDLTLSGVLYHNEIQNSPSTNTLLADAKVVWRLGRIRLTAQLRNMFNKQTYAETTYSGIGIFTNRYWLRPRELMVSMQFSL